MFKEIDRKVIVKVLSLGVSALLLLLFLVIRINKIQLVKEAYIILAIIVSFLLFFGFGVFVYPKFKKYVNEKHLNLYYQIVDFLVMLNIALFVIQLFFMVGFYPVEVDGPSMMPSLYDGEKLIVQAIGKPDNGSIVVIRVDENFNSKKDLKNGKELVKRVIAVPGDYFYFNEESKLVLNGVVITEDYLLDEDGNFYNTNGSLDINEVIKTRTNPFDFRDKAKINGQSICTPSSECVVPEDYYFVMGDNRSISHDSRDFGLVHKSQILGLIRYKRNSFLDWEKVQ